MPITITHPHKISQHTFGGHTSCTFCSLEASYYFLHGFVFYDNPQLRNNLMHDILKGGVAMDRLREKRQHRSTDEALNISQRFQNAFQLIGLSVKTPEDPLAFQQVLNSLRNRSNGDRLAAIITKPPETIAVMFDPHSYYPYIIFDSHVRGTLGAAFHFFESQSQCESHLKSLFPLSKDSNRFMPIPHNSIQGGDVFEVNYIRLRGYPEFVDATTFLVNPEAYLKHKNELDMHHQSMNGSQSLMVSMKNISMVDPAIGKSQSSENGNTKCRNVNTETKNVNLKTDTTQVFAQGTMTSGQKSQTTMTLSPPSHQAGTMTTGARMKNEMTMTAPTVSDSGTMTASPPPVSQESRTIMACLPSVQQTGTMTQDDHVELALFRQDETSHDETSGELLVSSNSSNDTTSFSGPDDLDYIKIIRLLNNRMKAKETECIRLKKENEKLKNEKNKRTENSKLKQENEQLREEVSRLKMAFERERLRTRLLASRSKT